jgi:AAA15 family ATPase/GTPase
VYIKSFSIKNFKSLENIVIELNLALNVFTGKNNCGKTTVLEALSLWVECFNKLIMQARRSTSVYKQKDWVLGNTQTKYFPFESIKSVRNPFFEDIFYNRNRKNKIELNAILDNDGDELEVNFTIAESGMNYVIESTAKNVDYYEKFNSFFTALPNAFGLYYASPVSVILQNEGFVTEPVIKDAILNRQSYTVIRNRLYKLYASRDRFDAFLRDFMFVLFNSTSSELFSLFVKSNAYKDTRVLIDFTKGNKDVEKDISLLGSGSLQVIEILLNLYQQSEDKCDLNIVLLDEPDSHIHRDIQKRLMEVLIRFSKNNQIFISSHNESLIRSVPYHQLFHLSGDSVAIVKPVGGKNLQKIAIPHFKGAFPSLINPLIRSFGATTGLDMINAIEADRIIFVEGEDDARIYNRLLHEMIGNSSKKFMFWVLGGISKIYDKLTAYQLVFKDIKNGKNLWEKSVLIMDKDYLSSDHAALLKEAIYAKLGIKTYVTESYTQESLIFKDLAKLSLFISKKIRVGSNREVSIDEIMPKLSTEYESMKSIFASRFNDGFYSSQFYTYKKLINTDFKKSFAVTKPLASLHDGEITLYMQKMITTIIDSGEYFKLMNKGDVENILAKIFADFGVTFVLEEDFYDFISLVDKSLWIDAWDFLNEI